MADILAENEISTLFALEEDEKEYQVEIFDGLCDVQFLEDEEKNQELNEEVDGTYYSVNNCRSLFRKDNNKL